MDNSGPSSDLGQVAGPSSQPATAGLDGSSSSSGLSRSGSVARRNLRARPSEPSSIPSPISKRARSDTNTKLRPPTEKELDVVNKALSEEAILAKRDVVVKDKEAEVKRVVDGHDDAVREKFHLERFISIFEGWDPKDAKQDNSPVFLEYKRSQYNLLDLMPTLPASQVAGPSRSRTSIGSRTTRRQATEQTELFSSEPVRQPELSSTSSTSSKSKGKGRQSDIEVPQEVEVVKPKLGRPFKVRTEETTEEIVKPKLGRPFKVRNDEMLPPPIPDKKGKGKGRRATMGGELAEQDVEVEEVKNEDVEPPLKKRRGRPPRLSLPCLPSQDVEDESPASPAIRSSPDPQPTPMAKPALPSLAHLPFPPPPSQPRERPRGTRKIYYTDYSHLPTTTPEHDGDLSAIMNSYIHLEDTAPMPDLKTLELKAATEAYYRNRVNYLQHQGRLLRLLDDDDTSNAKISTKPPTLPPRKTDYQDSLLAHMVQVRNAMLNEARLKPIICKKIARMIQAHWEHIEGKDDRERAAEEKKRKLQMKELIKSLRRRWALAVKVVRAKLVQLQKEEQDRLGKEHLQNMLQRSTGLLDAHRDEFAGREGEDSELEDGSSGTDEVSSAEDSEEDDSDEDDDDEEEAAGGEEGTVNGTADPKSDIGLRDGSEQAEALVDEHGVNGDITDGDESAEDPEGDDDIDTRALLADDELEVDHPSIEASVADAVNPVAVETSEVQANGIIAPSVSSPQEAHTVHATAATVRPQTIAPTVNPVEPLPTTNGEPSTADVSMVPSDLPNGAPAETSGHATETPRSDQSEPPIIRPRSKRQRAKRSLKASTTPAPESDDPDAGDIEFQVGKVSDIDEKDHELDVEMEDDDEDADRQGDSEDDGLLADADVPIEELLRRYGVPMTGTDAATPNGQVVSVEQPEQSEQIDTPGQLEAIDHSKILAEPEQPEETEQPGHLNIDGLPDQPKVEQGTEMPADQSLVDAAISGPTSPVPLIEGKRQRRVRSVWTPEDNPAPLPKKPKVQIISTKGEPEPEVVEEEEEEESDPQFTSSEEESSEDGADEGEVMDVDEEDKEPVDPNRLRAPFLLRGSLRPYQHAGLEWLASLYTNNVNGILADEMGLGKTIQTISLLAHLACDKGIWGQHLIIVPTSVILNWEMEFKKFLPGMKVLTYYGNQKERKEKRIGWATQHHFQVCITSYQIVLADQHIFRRKNWVYMILDEAHNIKNFRSQRWQTLLGFKAQRRLLLTGTPLQNNLMELWSLLYFLMPGGIGANDTAGVGFANHKEFTEWFSNPMDKAVESGDIVDEETLATISKLHTLLRPFILRRLKSEVETQLPGKFEHVVYCKLSKRQRFLYDEFMDRASTKEALSSGGYLGVVNTLMQLRKVCNHPDLFEVRPVRTSFAMDPVVGNYEPVELLVRKRLMAEGDEEINLEALNLRITDNENLSSWVCQTRQTLDASDRLPYAIEPVSTKKGKQANGPPIDTLTVDGWLKHRAWNEEQKSISRWRSLRDKNRIRCSARPIYGSTLLNMLSDTPNVLHPSSLPSTRSHWCGEHDPPASQLVASFTDRSRVLEPVVNLYAVIPPNVVARDLSRYALPGLTPMSHPALTDPSFDTLHQSTVKLQIAFPDSSLLQYDCGKLQTLYTMLRDLKAGGHRVLIFTQMTRVLDILEMFLSYNGHRYLRLDGSTKIEDRQIITERFNSDNRIFCFIASSRSGGVGINLTGADTVFFYDSDWNPSMDRQCMDRAHRIGQTREVHIYRFVSTHTVEENMLKKANQKRMLDKVVIQEGEFTTDFFGKMDWRDVIDPISEAPPTNADTPEAKIEDINMDDEPEAVDQEVLRPRAGEERELAKALAEVEDEEDAAAARVAQGEGELDFEEFDADKEKERVVPKRVGFQVQEEGSATPAPATAHEGDEEEEVEEEDDGIGGVDEYMLRFVEWDWEFFVRYRA